MSSIIKHRVEDLHMLPQVWLQHITHWHISEKVPGTAWRLEMDTDEPWIACRDMALGLRAFERYKEQLSKLPAKYSLYGAVRDGGELSTFDLYDSSAKSFLAPVDMIRILREACGWGDNGMPMAPVWTGFRGSLLECITRCKTQIVDCAGGEGAMSSIDATKMLQGLIVRPYSSELYDIDGNRCITKIMNPAYLTSLHS